MVEEQAEMSLDEVLSSIKQMVVDKDPPVLELTDMVSADGTIVKVKHGKKDPKGKSELRDFLRLAQESGKDSVPVKQKTVRGAVQDGEANDTAAAESVSFDSDSDFATSSAGSASFAVDGENKELPRQASAQNPMASDRTKITVDEIVREVTAPLIKDWLEKNLPSLAKEVITAEIRKMIKQN